MKITLSYFVLIVFFFNNAFAMGGKRPDPQPQPKPQTSCLDRISKSGLLSAFNQYVKEGNGKNEKAGAIYLINKNGDVEKTLMEVNPHVPQAVASTQKIITAYTAIESYGHLSDKVVFTREDMSVDVQGGRGRFPSGKIVEVDDEISISDMLRTLIAQSSNGSANAIARGSAGSIEAFVMEMNVQVDRVLGQHSSFFQNPSGLTDYTENDRYMDEETEQLSTANNMAIFLGHMMRSEKVRSALGKAGVGGASQGRLQKFGYTRKAGRTFVATSPMKDSCSQYSVSGAFFGSQSSSQFSSFLKMWEQMSSQF